MDVSPSVLKSSALKSTALKGSARSRPEACSKATNLPVLPGFLYQRCVELLKEACGCSSPSDGVSGLERMAEFWVESFHELREEAEIRWIQGKPAVLVGDLDAPLLAIGHMDTVLPAAEPKIDGDHLVATGAVDMKGGLVAFWGALAWLGHRGLNRPSFRLVIVPDEEIGGNVSETLTAEQGQNAERVWCLEPGALASEALGAEGTAETIVGGRRGLVAWQLLVQGRSAHTGPDFRQGRSALLAAAHWSNAVSALNGSEHQPTINVSRLVAGDQDLVDSEKWSLIGSPHHLNVVPDRALVEGELRFLNVGDGEDVLRRLEAAALNLKETHGVDAEFRVTERIPALPPTEEQMNAARRVVEAAERRGRKLHIETDRHGVSLTNFLPERKRVEVLDGLGPVGGGMHTRDEFVSLSSLKARIELLADLLEAVEPV